MSDPAIEAAERASLLSGGGNVFIMADGITAAREALKPIRELHSSGEKCTCCWGHYADGSPVPKRRMCMACGVHWPCETAKLVYSAEELES